MAKQKDKSSNKIERKFGLGVLVLIFNKEFSKILLLKRNEEKRKKNNADWGFVGGRVELGEKLLDSCIREVREETNLHLNQNDLILIDIKENPFLTEIHHAIWFIYSIGIEEKEKITLNSESEEYGWFDIEKLPERMIDSLEEAKNLIKKVKETRG
jgi:ADP-ribose pyrophosphatase YjhB (NUDIX family)